MFFDILQHPNTRLQYLEGFESYNIAKNTQSDSSPAHEHMVLGHEGLHLKLQVPNVIKRN